MKLTRLIYVFVFALVTESAQAALYDRGGGLVYDDVLNVTWLQDANYRRGFAAEATGAQEGKLTTRNDKPLRREAVGMVLTAVRLSTPFHNGSRISAPFNSNGCYAICGAG